MEPVMQLKLVATARDDPDEVNLSGEYTVEGRQNRQDHSDPISLTNVEASRIILSNLIYI